MFSTVRVAGAARLLAALTLLWAWPAWAGLVTVDVLDVGQGDAIVVRGGGKTVLIDAGIRGADVAGKLQMMGVTRLDLVVATHPHADHIGGMANVIERFDIGLYLDNGMPHTTRTYDRVMRTLEEHGVPYRTAESRLTLSMGDEAAFTVLFPTTSPLRGTRSDLNSNSVVMRLDHSEVSFLFTGDAEKPTEDALMHIGLEPVDVLKVAHHGSKHSSSNAFLRKVRPRYALVSVGADNRYGHPAEPSLARLAAQGAMVYRTDQSHTLRAVSTGTSVEILEGTLAELQSIALVDPGGSTTPVAVPPAPTEVDEVAVADGRLTCKERRAERKQRRLERKRQRAAEKAASGTPEMYP